MEKKIYLCFLAQIAKNLVRDAVFTWKIKTKQIFVYEKTRLDLKKKKKRDVEVIRPVSCRKRESPSKVRVKNYARSKKKKLEKSALTENSPEALSKSLNTSNFVKSQEKKCKKIEFKRAKKPSPAQEEVAIVSGMLNNDSFSLFFKSK